MKLFNFPTSPFTKKNSTILPDTLFPYKQALYSIKDLPGEIRVLKDVEEEVRELIRRYAMVFPESVLPTDTERYVQYRCLVHDEHTGITRGILERLGYELIESEYDVYQIYWIELKTRGELRRKG